MQANGYEINKSMTIHNLYSGDNLQEDMDKLLEKIKNYFEQFNETLSSLEVEGKGLSPEDFLIGGNFIIAEPLNNISSCVNDILNSCNDLVDSTRASIKKERNKQVDELTKKLEEAISLEEKTIEIRRNEIKEYSDYPNIVSNAQDKLDTATYNKNRYTNSLNGLASAKY